MTLNYVNKNRVGLSVFKISIYKQVIYGSMSKRFSEIPKIVGELFQGTDFSSL
jgi:hypothetical protein